MGLTVKAVNAELARRGIRALLAPGGGYYSSVCAAGFSIASHERSCSVVDRRDAAPSAFTVSLHLGISPRKPAPRARAP